MFGKKVNTIVDKCFITNIIKLCLALCRTSARRQIMTFGEYLHMKRIEAKITIRSFASMVGISPSFLCDLESGSRAFPENSKKVPDLLEKMIKTLQLSENDSEIFKNYAKESMLLGNRVPTEISEYLKSVPEAQQALRLANEKSVKKEEWEKFIKILKEK